MLVLSRKQKQQIRIGDDVVVTVLQIKGGSVRIGIEAPREVHVMRGELEEFRQPVVASSSSPVGKSTPEKEAQADEAEIPEPQESARILELRFEGNSEEGHNPTRLSEIASSIASLNLPR